MIKGKAYREVIKVEANFFLRLYVYIYIGLLFLSLLDYFFIAMDLKRLVISYDYYGDYSKHMKFYGEVLAWLEYSGESSKFDVVGLSENFYLVTIKHLFPVYILHEAQFHIYYTIFLLVIAYIVLFTRFNFSPSEMEAGISRVTKVIMTLFLLLISGKIMIFCIINLLVSRRSIDYDMVSQESFLFGGMYLIYVTMGVLYLFNCRKKIYLGSDKEFKIYMLRQVIFFFLFFVLSVFAYTIGATSIDHSNFYLGSRNFLFLLSFVFIIVILNFLKLKKLSYS